MRKYMGSGHILYSEYIFNNNNFKQPSQLKPYEDQLHQESPVQNSKHMVTFDILLHCRKCFHDF